MQELTRRQFLAFLGGGTALVACGAIAPHWSAAATGGLALPFTPVRLPHPLPIYTTNKNFLGTAIGSGSVLGPDSAPELAQYTVLDDVVVPPEFERYLILAWGDRIFPNSNDYVGYNHDYTGYVPLAGKNDGLLWVNHEYVSYPFSEIAPETPAGLVGNSFEAVIGFPLPKDSAGAPVKNREFLGECLYNVGGTVARIIRDRPFGQFHVAVGDERNRRIHGLSGLAINAQRADAYSKVTAWGARPHQAGDENYLIATGPTANEVFERVNADGLGNRIIGTAFNCSGDTTPWGTFISTEENFQGSSLSFVGVTEDVRPDGSQTGYIAGTTGAEFGLVGEKYGWILEIDPRDPQSRGKKHTALGRFRHENVAMRVAAGEPLVVYSGDDRRGGHVWKFVSNGAVHNRNDPNNSQLLEDGTLFAAKFNPDGTGLWIPLVLTTPTNPNVPSEIGSAQKAAEGVIDRNGLVKLPRRNGIAGQTVDGGAFNVDTTNEGTVLPAYRGKTLADFYSSQGAILVDAFLAANLVGGTPTARPEDKEIHPQTKEVFIAFTDGVAGSDGYADSRIFQVSKYTSDVNAAQPSGGLYKIIEDSRDASGLTFHWQRSVQAGEAGAADGVGFANVDNLVFDFKGNVWGVTDMSTSNHNGFNVGPNPEPRTINHALAGSSNAANLVGVFGNNWLFYIPTSGPEAGTVVPLAYGPTRCEMTGPTFVGNTLIISVQHPGEDSPIGSQNDGPLNRDIEILSLAGGVFAQNRTLPKGSVWPSNILGKGPNLPKPATIGIRHKAGRAHWQTDDDE